MSGLLVETVYGLGPTSLNYLPSTGSHLRISPEGHNGNSQENLLTIRLISLAYLVLRPLSKGILVRRGLILLYAWPRDE